MSTSGPETPKVMKKALKLKSSVISSLAGCGCRSGLDIALDQTLHDSQMPEVCSVKSPEYEAEQCNEWRSVGSFDEMLKCSSSSTDNVRYVDNSTLPNNSLPELEITQTKFSDMVTEFQRNDHEIDGSFNPTMRGFEYPHRKILSVTKMGKGLVPSNLLIVKNSSDPEREFRDSMVEMIHGNRISSGEDLEELLSCFLLLNSAVYHDVIIQVFKEIWADLIHASTNQ